MKLLSMILYLASGWLAVLVMKPLYMHLPFSGFLFLMAGGLFYTAGTFFYSRHKILYNHAIWHLFVLLGTTSHFFSVLSLLEG